jgi:hypothetical protein
MIFNAAQVRIALELVIAYFKVIILPFISDNGRKPQMFPN